MKIKDFEIIVPDYKPLIKKLHSLSRMNLYFINRFQKEERFYPNSNAGCEDYCLYLGSMEDTLIGADGKEYKENCDLWHYPYYGSRIERYSTAIIYGNEPGNYKSGWASLALVNDAYNRLLRREVVCGLVDDPTIIVDLGLAVLDLRSDMSDVQYNPVINEAGGGVDSHTDGDFEDYYEPDWWTHYWWEEEFNRKMREKNL